MGIKKLYELSELVVESIFPHSRKITFHGLLSLHRQTLNSILAITADQWRRGTFENLLAGWWQSYKPYRG